MSYYVLDRRAIKSKDITLMGSTYDSAQEVVEEVFYEGISLKNQIKEPFTVVLDDRRTVYNEKLLDKISIDTNQTGAALLISPKAQEIFTKLKLPVELIDVTIKGNKILLKDYKFVNVIGRIKCTDRKRSKLEFLGKDIIQIYDSLVLNETKIPDNTDIFLLGEDITMMVIVSNRVKDAIEEAQLTGFKFIKPEDYKTFR